LNRLSIVLLAGCVAVHGVLAAGLIVAGLGFPVLGIAQYPVIDMPSVTTTTTSVTTGYVSSTMGVSGVVRWGSFSGVAGGPSAPSGYVEGGPVSGLEVVAYLVTGVDSRGFPVMTVLAKVTTNSLGQYSVVFVTNSSVLGKPVLVQALNQYGEARKVMYVEAGSFNGDMTFQFERAAYSLLPFSVFNVQVGQCMFFIDERWIPVVVASWFMGTVGLILRKRT
jgi:hypothetical protein